MLDTTTVEILDEKDYMSAVYMVASMVVVRVCDVAVKTVELSDEKDCKSAVQMVASVVVLRVSD